MNVQLKRFFPHSTHYEITKLPRLTVQGVIIVTGILGFQSNAIAKLTGLSWLSNHIYSSAWSSQSIDQRGERTDELLELPHKLHLQAGHIISYVRRRQRQAFHIISMVRRRQRQAHLRIKVQ